MIEKTSRVPIQFLVLLVASAIPCTGQMRISSAEENNKAQATSAQTAKRHSATDLVHLGTPTTAYARIGDKININQSSTVLLKGAKGRFVLAISQLEHDGNKAMLIVVLDTSVGEGKVQIDTYPLQGSIATVSTVVYDPVFSPDGRYILFKYGPLSDPFDSYFPFILDTQTKKLAEGYDQLLSYKFLSWSPDSNYIAVIQGGADSSGNTIKEGAGGNAIHLPLKLYIYDWRAQKKYLIAENDTIRAPFSWIAPNTLIYGMLPEQRLDKDLKSEDKATEGRDQVSRPDVYSYSINNKSKLLIKDGYQPLPSPDGQRIVFFGSENPLKPQPLRLEWMFRPQGAALSVAKLHGEERVAFTPMSGIYPFIRWLPDNRHFVVVEQVQFSPEAEAQVTEWDVVTQGFHKVANLKAEDYKKILLSPFTYPKFLPLEAPNGEELYVLVNEYIASPEGNRTATAVKSLRLLNLKTGEVTTIARVQGASVDWLYLPTGVKQ